MSIKVKICGLKDPDTVRETAKLGADWIGFVFVEGSARYVPTYAAETLLLNVGNAVPVALLADADDKLIDAVMGLRFPVLQLHGAETPTRVAEIKARTGAEVWKAAGISAAADIAALDAFAAADRFLLDAKPPTGSAITGGHGAAFDWSILADDAPTKPWLLAGGLTPDNVAGAVAATGARAVDVSSGVERARGLKDMALIEAFIAAAKAV